MAELVPPGEIEEIVGARRHRIHHIGRAISPAQTVYILHSQDCAREHPDLRTCPYSVALDRGINPTQWLMDQPVILTIGRSTGRVIGETAWMAGRDG